MSIRDVVGVLGGEPGQQRVAQVLDRHAGQRRTRRDQPVQAVVEGRVATLDQAVGVEDDPRIV